MSSIKTVQLNGIRFNIDTNKLLQVSSIGNSYYAHSPQYQQEYCVQIIPKVKGINNSLIYKSILGQTLMLKTLNHQNIVNVKEVIQTSNNIYIFTQLCHSTLATLMKNYKLSQSQSIDLIQKISHGRLYLLQEGIVLQQLSPQTIFIKDKIPKIQIYGTLKTYSNTFNKNPTLISNFYLPPETVKFGIFTLKQDIWSIGMIFYQMLHQSLPYKVQSLSKFHQMLQEFPISINEKSLHKQSIDFLEKTLIVQERNRIDWNQLLNHEIFKNELLQQDSKNVIEDKTKIIMKKLKIIVEVNKLNLNRILISLGFKNPHQQIQFQAFYKFIQRIEPVISENEALYIFQKTDIDKSGKISFHQIQNLFQKYGIKLCYEPNEAKSYKNINPQEQSNAKLNEQALQKVQRLFKNIYQSVNGDSQKFEEFFNSFSKNSKISFSNFLSIFSRFQKDPSQKQAEEVFKIIDQDCSGNIDYLEFQNLYYRVNGLPPKIRILPPSRISVKAVPIQIQNC